jgi:hypothetical protein
MYIVRIDIIGYGVIKLIYRLTQYMIKVFELKVCLQSFEIARIFSYIDQRTFYISQ